MRKQISVFLVVIILFTTLFPHKVIAQKNASLSAGQMLPEQTEGDQRVKILAEYLKQYNSPLVPYAKDFVAEADRNNLNWKLVASIAGVESYFGQQIPPASYNGWGFGVYGTNVRYFTSWQDGIATVSKALRQDYLGKWGATNVPEIGKIYAADPAWSQKVTHFINEMDIFEAQYANKTLPISF